MGGDDIGPLKAAIAPAATGSATWPSRFPIRRTARAVARVPGDASDATQAIDTGCPILSFAARLEHARHPACVSTPD